MVHHTGSNSVRDAKPGDAARLAEIVRLSPEAGRWTESDLERSIAGSTTRRCWVAERGGGVAGFLLVEQAAADETEILTLAVDPAVRRQGVARDLLTELLRSGKGRVFLEVRSSNQAAQRLYDRFGFTIAGRRPAYYASPPDDAIIMQRACFQ